MGLLPNYGRFIGKISSLRQPSIIRELLKILSTATPEMIPLSGGLPNPEMFPFRTADFVLKDGEKVRKIILLNMVVGKYVFSSGIR